MSLFKDMLKNDESLFKQPIALDIDFIPPRIKYREEEQEMVASAIKPLFADRNGRNAIVTGSPGIGKTLACKKVIEELEDETDEIDIVFVSCWQKNSSFKIMVDICHQLGYKLTHNKRTDDLFEEIKSIANRSKTVFVFDEIDKADDLDFLYSILEEIYKKSIILITNYKEWITGLDERIRSRLTPETIEFGPYTIAETEGIIKERIKYAFVDDVIDEPIIKRIAEMTFEAKDIRRGLFLLKESANCAEDRARRKIIEEDLKKAIDKIPEFKKRDENEVDDSAKEVLKLIKHNSGKKIGELYKIYQKERPDAVYKTFQRKVKRLDELGMISTKTVTGGSGGSTTLITYDTTKKLTDF